MAAKARLGFIGLGSMGRDLLKETIRNPKAEVVALCDGDPEALAEAAGMCESGPAKYSEYRRLLDAEELDGVVIASPQHMHASTSIDALDAGCTTYCEKPMALNVKECDAMIAASKRNNKGLMIGQVLRYINVYRFVLESAKSGEYGAPLAVRIIRSSGPSWGRLLRDWRRKRETAGGLLLEINVHEIDFMRCIMGEAASVSALGKRFINKETDYEDFITVQIAFASGGFGCLTSASCDFLGKYAGEVFLEKGSISFDSSSQLVRIAKVDQEKQEIPYREVHPEWESGVYREMREFVEACLGEHPITIPGEEGMKAVEIAEACYLSIKESRRVVLPLPR